MAVYFAMLKPGDTIMGMNLAHGGHLTHGSPVNMSGKYFNIVPYGVSEEEQTIDYDELMRIAKECRPKMIVAGASAYPRAIDFKKFRKVADEVGAYLMVIWLILPGWLRHASMRVRCPMLILLLQPLIRPYAARAAA